MNMDCLRNCRVDETSNKEDRTQDPKTFTQLDQHLKLTQDAQWHPKALHFTINQIPTLATAQLS